ncbi:hypothetical protein J1N35_000799 [Gossypium stocksii]|uniref:Uncharacterized protein n=1 Tax=Gossypium stocksii TaxID=47602 RepID=A0A9D4AKU0_9ROSI|nr:hypothetical protein J1N35_000799 [Gossypium stocksii]
MSHGYLGQNFNNKRISELSIGQCWHMLHLSVHTLNLYNYYFYVIFSPFFCTNCRSNFGSLLLIFPIEFPPITQGSSMDIKIHPLQVNRIPHAEVLGNANHNFNDMTDSSNNVAPPTRTLLGQA